MIFAKLPLNECQGAILAHSQSVGAEMFRKGRVLSAADIETLRTSGLSSITVARLESGDIGEDEAARRLANALIGDSHHLTLDPAFAGRVNLNAATAGIIKLDHATIDALNAVNEAVTLATLPPFSAVQRGQIAATLKIIPYAVGKDVLEKALACIAAASQPLLQLYPYRRRRIALIQTELAGIKASVLEKTERVTTGRLAAMGQDAPTIARCAHTQSALSDRLQQTLKSGAEMVLIVGASAISDRRDVVPAAIAGLGGTIDHFGMPVDPGNLLLLAHIGQVPVLGLPGCARSLKLNGCDWVMQRLLADLSVGASDIQALGIGGLLAEIPGRPHPRDMRSRPQQPKVAAIVLAAGRSSRMGRNKLLLDWNGKPIIAHVIDRLTGMGFAETILVIGYQATKVRAALGSRTDLKIIEARDHATGMSASLKAGIKSLKPSTDAALVILGDMPQISDDLLKRLVAAYQPLEGRTIVLPVAEGKRGNPVLFDRRFFADIEQLEGDVGARHIIGSNAESVAEIPAAAHEIFVDVDTPDAYQQLLAKSAHE